MISMKTAIPFDMDEVILKTIKEAENRIEKEKMIHKINETYKEWCIKESIEQLIKNNKVERKGKRIRLVK